MSEQWDTHPQYVVKNRQRGKTTLLIDWVKQGQPLVNLVGWTRVLIVRDLQTKRFLMRRFNLDDHQVISRREAAQLGRQIDITMTSFAIDDAEDLILDTFGNSMMWNRIKLVTMTGDNTLQEAEIIRAVLENPARAAERLAELDKRLTEQPDPTMLNAEGQVEERVIYDGSVISLPPIMVKGPPSKKRTAKKAGAKKTSPKRS